MEATGQGSYHRTIEKTASLSGAPPSRHNASVAEQQAQKKRQSACALNLYAGVRVPTADFAAVFTG
jgi:hypothetical protein